MIPEEISRFEERYQELEKGVMERKAPAEAEQRSEEKMPAKLTDVKRNMRRQQQQIIGMQRRKLLAHL